MALFIQLLILFALAIFQHYNIESLGLSIGLNHTYSKLLPYFVEFLLVCFLVFQANKSFLKNKSRGLKKALSVFILVAGCGIAFAFHPIYEGDFTNTYRKMIVSGRKAEVFKPGLTMVALPGCQFCLARREDLNAFKKHHPSVGVNVIVINNDTLAMEEYKETLSENIHVEVTDDLSAIEMIIKGRYPSFFFKSSSETQELIHWTNNEFGVTAMDWIVDESDNVDE
jgi:hypothetical protein